MRLLERDAPERSARTRTRGRDPWGASRGPRLLCVRCGHPITAGGWARAVGEAHEHSFVNPHGYLYRIGCFEQAPGCVPEGDEHPEYSWFEGYTWQLAQCGGCRSHLGWAFRRAGDRFHGLILDRVVQEQRGEPGDT
jgi:hypothetical protein